MIKENLTNANEREAAAAGTARQREIWFRRTKRDQNNQPRIGRFSSPSEPKLPSARGRECYMLLVPYRYLLAETIPGCPAPPSFRYSEQAIQTPVDHPRSLRWAAVVASLNTSSEACVYLDSGASSCAEIPFIQKIDPSSRTPHLGLG